jgi:hypothetical protein
MMCGDSVNKKRKAFLIGVIALCTRSKLLPMPVPCTGTTAPFFSPLPDPNYPLFPNPPHMRVLSGTANIIMPDTFLSGTRVVDGGRRGKLQETRLVRAVRRGNYRR